MKTIPKKITVAVTAAICVAVLITLATGFAGHAAPHQGTACSQQQSAPVLPGGAYFGLLNGLTAEGGR